METPRTGAVIQGLWNSQAKAMPVLLNNCSQFIVEFAGDFVTQDNHQFVPDPNNPNVLVANENWGNVTGIGPDNVIDLVIRILIEAAVAIAEARNAGPAAHITGAREVNGIH